MSERWDIAIVGAGMAGASLASRLAGHARVVLIEAEPAPGYHATGRSAAFWSETYGGPGVQPLTTASRGELQQLGRLFCERFELEDCLIEVLHNAHRQKAQAVAGHQ